MECHLDPDTHTTRCLQNYLVTHQINLYMRRSFDAHISWHLKRVLLVSALNMICQQEKKRLTDNRSEKKCVSLPLYFLRVDAVSNDKLQHLKIIMVS